MQPVNQSAEQAKTERRFRGDGTAAPCRHGSRRCRSGLGDLAGPDARRADAHALDVALAVGDAHRAQVGQEATLRDAGGVQADAALVLGRALADDDVARRRALAADFANSRHCSVPFVWVSLVGLAGLPFDVRKGVVERGGESAEAFAAGGCGVDGSLLLAGRLGHQALDLVLGHAHRADRQADAALAAVDLDDARLDLLADLKRIAHLLDALVG